MSTTQPTPIKVSISRAWHDLAPKLLAFLTGGTAATAIVYALHHYLGVTLDPALANLIVVLAGAILGYFVKDKAVIDGGTVTPGSVAVITALQAVPNASIAPMTALPTTPLVAPVVQPFVAPSPNQTGTPTGV